MIQEFEQLLATNAFGNLEATKQHLLQKANDDRQNRIAEIERDFKLCELLQFGLTLPKECPAYGISRGTINWFRKKYPQDDSTQRVFRKMLWSIDHGLTERSEKHDKHEEHTEKAGTGSGRNGEGMQTGVPEELSAEEQRQSEEMEC